MDILHHCEKALGGATVARGKKRVRQPVWPNSFLLLVDPLCPSALSHTDATGHRSSLARMASADLIQTKGLGLALCSAR
jgi:hypothetical protein